MTCLITGLHATDKRHRPGIFRWGLLPNSPHLGRPFGVYVFTEDGSFNHPAYKSRVMWSWGPAQDVYRVAYFGRSMIDQYVINGFIMLGPVPFVTLVTRNIR